MVQFLYLSHLLVPALVLYDAVEAYHRGFRGKASYVLMVFGAIWLLGGLALWMLRKRPRVKQWIPNVTLTVFAVFVTFILTEIAISMIFPAFRTGLNRTPRPPNLTVELVQNPFAVPGQELNTFVRTNGLGMRGPSLKDKDG